MGSIIKISCLSYKYFIKKITIMFWTLKRQVLLNDNTSINKLFSKNHCHMCILYILTSKQITFYQHEDKYVYKSCST